MKGFEEVRGMIEDYTHSREGYKVVINAIAEFDDLDDRKELQNGFEEFKDSHGRGRRDLNKSVEEARKSRVSSSKLPLESEFFEDGKFRPVRVANALQEDKDYLFSTEDGILRVYRDGAHVVDQHRETQREIHGMLGDWVRPHAVAQVISLLEDKTAGPMPFHRDWINLQNGRLCIHSFELLDHNPAFKSVTQLPITYDKQAKCPEFDKWLSDVLPEADDQMLLLQLMGYSMLQDARFSKIAVLYGPTHTGKSTCLDLVRHFLGFDNVSSVSLHALDDESLRFSSAALFGKLANISADLSSKHLAGDSIAKQIASGDSIAGEFKNRAIFSFSPFSTLWNSSNQLPVSRDRTDAWYERLVIIPFIRQHKGERADRNLLSKLTQPEEMFRYP